jgi:hypothetical protein
MTRGKGVHLRDDGHPCPTTRTDSERCERLRDSYQQAATASVIQVTSSSKWAKEIGSSRGGFNGGFRPCRRPATGTMAGINKQSENDEDTAAAKYTGRKLRRTVDSPPQLVSTETRPFLPIISCFRRIAVRSSTNSHAHQREQYGWRHMQNSQRRATAA